MMRARHSILLIGWMLGLGHLPAGEATNRTPTLSRIRLGENGSHFVFGRTGEPFTPWGFNYDHDDSGRLLEDYWIEEWPTVAEDFHEMKQLGANVVRIHLQLGRFMKTPDQADTAALKQLRRLLQLAEETGLYLDLTGLGCYHKQDVPGWYDALPEHARWTVQARFWGKVAETCAASPAVFCYDLMNEPILPGEKKRESDWLGPEFAGKYFVQRISLDLAGRTREEVAAAWVKELRSAIRMKDKDALITVGVIPWALVFPGAKPIFYSKAVAPHLDFVSAHFYPEKGEVEKAIGALSVYAIGKPVVVEEMFPLRCSMEELDRFVEGSKGEADGWIGFYWGKTVSDYEKAKPGLAGAITKSWLEYFRDKSATIRNLPRQTLDLR